MVAVAAPVLLYARSYLCADRRGRIVAALCGAFLLVLVGVGLPQEAAHLVVADPDALEQVLDPGGGVADGEGGLEPVADLVGAAEAARADLGLELFDLRRGESQRFESLGIERDVDFTVHAADPFHLRDTWFGYELPREHVLHQPAPYNLEALRDLYTQVPEQTIKVKRFGSDVFLTRGMATREMPIDLPIGPDYVLGPGDGLTISIWGGVSQSFTRVIDREGKLVLPEAGSIVVGS